MSVKKLLSNATASFLIKEANENSNIVIGAPHHAPGGQKTLPCREHPDSDENTGYIAAGVAELLGANLVIACNATTDPNKSMNSEYSRQITAWKPKYLIEIHGHGGMRVKPNIIEISSGSKEESKLSEKFAEVLDQKLKVDTVLREYIPKGDYDNLTFKAAGTPSIIDKRWTAYHIEFPPGLRLKENNDLPDRVAVLIQNVADTIKELCE